MLARMRAHTRPHTWSAGGTGCPSTFLNSDKSGDAPSLPPVTTTRGDTASTGEEEEEGWGRAGAADEGPTVEAAAGATEGAVTAAAKERESESATRGRANTHTHTRQAQEQSAHFHVHMEASEWVHSQADTRYGKEGGARTCVNSRVALLIKLP